MAALGSKCHHRYTTAVPSPANESQTSVSKALHIHTILNPRVRQAQNCITSWLERNKAFKQQRKGTSIPLWTVERSNNLEQARALRIERRQSTRAGFAIVASSKNFWSVVIPTYNRLPILQKALNALESQVKYLEEGITGYEVIVVDDGSSDDTVDVLSKNMGSYPHLRLLKQDHAGATAARNLGIKHAHGDTIVFIDSDMIVTPTFLAAHATALKRAYEADTDDRAFTYGRVVNTSNFEDPAAEPFKVTDYSAAFFATGNVAISKQRLLKAAELLEDPTGPFDADFSEYGWEDLELGERLRKQGARIVQCPDAIGYHWHPPFCMSQLPKLIDQERQRGMNGVRFYEKHPNLRVRLMIQLTPFHEGLWFLLTLGGIVNEKTLGPLLEFLVQKGQPGLALGLLSPVLNWHTVQAGKVEMKRRRHAAMQRQSEMSS